MSLGAAVLLFPGQGAQSPGMGKELVGAGHQPELLDLAEASGIPLRRLLVEGTAEELRPTEVAQPALFYTGVALGQLLVERAPQPLAAAGHSLGEYCAVVLSGSLGPAQGMALVLERGRLMATAGEGTMAAVLGLELEPLEELCRRAEEVGERCVVANDNAPGQVVVSGGRRAVERLGELAREAGAKRVLALQVGGAFHSPLMAAAAETFAARLDREEFRDPHFPVAAGVSATLSRRAEEVRTGLKDQLAGRVRWTETMRRLAEAGAGAYVECGPGSTLAGLGRRILPDAEVVGVSNPEQAAEVAGRLRGGAGTAARRARG